jgi:hypothetical protein
VFLVAVDDYDREQKEAGREDENVGGWDEKRTRKNEEGAGKKKTKQGT